jgi:hypothetical protein
VRTVPGAGSVDLGSAQSPHPGARSPSVTAARCKGSQFTTNTKKLNYAQYVVVQNLNPSICENLYRFALDRRTTFPTTKSGLHGCPLGAYTSARWAGDRRAALSAFTERITQRPAGLALDRRAIDINRLVPVGYWNALRNFLTWRTFFSIASLIISLAIS